MPQPAEDLWLTAFGKIVFFGSLGTWIYIVVKWRRDGFVIPYEARRPVPWGPAATVLAILLAAIAVLAGATLETAAQPPPVPDAAEAATQLVLALFPAIFSSIVFVLAVAIFSRALPRDLGLPTSLDELARDIWIGVLTCLAVVVPVFSILLVIRLLFGIEDVSRHPLVEIVNESGDRGILLLATVAAVVVAPVIEELTFRLLLQGWLEKSDAERMARTTIDQSTMTNGLETGGFSTHDPQASDHVATQARWRPIVITSFLFAMAHYGYGPEPVPIFVLALFLGYVYQRTHRIVPCMVAHGLFNAVSMFMLWRMVVTGGP